MKMLGSIPYSTVASTAALVIALGGTSYAAVKITGRDIQDNTLTTRDVKDKTLKVKDLSSRARTKLRGTVGPEGPRGPSDVFAVWNDGATEMTSTNKTVLSLTLAPGAYALQAKASAVRTSTGVAAFAVCTLRAENATLDASGLALPDVLNAGGTLVAQETITAPSAVTISFACSGQKASLAAKKLTALQVESVTRTKYADVP